MLITNEAPPARTGGMARPDRPRRTPWQRASLSCLGDVVPTVEAVVAAMAAAGYVDNDRFAMRLALEEAVVNGLRHGNQCDPARRVSVRYRVGPEQALVEVEDQGPGFNPGAVPDPLAPENLGRPGGRGLLLMRAYLTWVRYNDRGNAVTLCKARSA
jgi:serine/threonine-protein kinase RsbW